MICALTARRIADGQVDEFIEKFTGSGEDMPEEIRDKFKAVYACRDVDDPNVILTFGLFKGTIEELRELQGADIRTEQLEGINPLVQEVLIDSSFEVLHEFVGESAGASA